MSVQAQLEYLREQPSIDDRSGRRPALSLPSSVVVLGPRDRHGGTPHGTRARRNAGRSGESHRVGKEWCTAQTERRRLQMTTKVEKSVEVDVPVRTAYNQRTQFEEFPQFMGGVESVTQVDDTSPHWIAEIAGVRREWDAEILEQVPDQKVAWAAVGGATNAERCTSSPTAPTGRWSRSIWSSSQRNGGEGRRRLNLVSRQAESDPREVQVVHGVSRSRDGCVARRRQRGPAHGHTRRRGRCVVPRRQRQGWCLR